MFEVDGVMHTMDNSEAAPEGHVWVFDIWKRVFVASKVLDPPKTVVVKFQFGNELEAGMIQQFPHMPGFQRLVEAGPPQPEPVIVLAERERCARIAENAHIGKLPATVCPVDPVQVCTYIAAKIRAGKTEEAAG